jgi:hypothetical protein
MAYRSTVRIFLALAAASVLASCGSSDAKLGRRVNAIVSVRDQKLGVYKNGKLLKRYDISTSKFGLGDRPGSNCTPLGKHEVVAKIGHGLPAGAVLKSRHWNGEVVKPNAPGRDPIVSRILWLSGLERENRNAYGRCIYIHGTAEENRLGSPASYGCVRMAAKDVINLFNDLPVGAKVNIVTNRLPRAGEVEPVSLPAPTPLPAVQPAPLDLTGSIASASPASTPPLQQQSEQVYVAPSTMTTNSSSLQTAPVAAPYVPEYAPPPTAERYSEPSAPSAPNNVLPGPGVILKTRGYSPGGSLTRS